MALLNRLAKDHKLTKEDLALTLSDHACTTSTPPGAPPVPTPHFHCTEIDEMTTNGGITVRQSQKLTSLTFFQHSLQAKSGFEMCFDIGSQHLGCWGQSTPRIQNKEVYATLYLQAS